MKAHPRYEHTEAKNSSHDDVNKNNDANVNVNENNKKNNNNNNNNNNNLKLKLSKLQFGEDKSHSPNQYHGYSHVQGNPNFHTSTYLMICYRSIDRSIGNCVFDLQCNIGLKEQLMLRSCGADHLLSYPHHLGFVIQSNIDTFGYIMQVVRI